MSTTYIALSTTVVVGGAMAATDLDHPTLDSTLTLTASLTERRLTVLFAATMAGAATMERLCNWPTPLPTPNGRAPMVERILSSTIRTPFEAGYVQTRARWQRTRHSWTLAWSVLTTAQKTALQEFFSTTVLGGAESFRWLNPDNSTAYSVRFVNDKLEMRYIAPNIWEAEVELEEV